MLRARDITGKPVITRDDGAKIGSVHDVILSPDGSSLVALVLDGVALFGPAKMIPISQLVSVGDDAVIVAGKDAVVSADQYGEAKGGQGIKDVVGKTMVTDQGDKVGKVHDVVFDENSGRISGYTANDLQIGGSRYNDVFIPSQGVISIGPDVMVVQRQVIDQIFSQAQSANAPGQPPVDRPAPYTDQSTVPPAQYVDRSTVSQAQYPGQSTASPPQYPDQSATPQGYYNQPDAGQPPAQ